MPFDIISNELALDDGDILAAREARRLPMVSALPARHQMRHTACGLVVSPSPQPHPCNPWLTQGACAAHWQLGCIKSRGMATTATSTAALERQPLCAAPSSARSIGAVASGHRS